MKSPLYHLGNSSCRLGHIQLDGSEAPVVASHGERPSKMATTMVNGTASSETNSSNPTMANVGRKQSKPDAGNKTLDTRKQAGNFGDGAQR